MDYEKAYKQALETARRLQSGEVVPALSGMTNYELIFPELKESEDERIRKQLLNWFKNCHWDSIDEDKTPLKRYDIIAWFERQGSQNLANSEKTCKIEQKSSIEICPHSINSKSYLETGYPVDQNPAWSEEDEEMLKDIIRGLKATEQLIFTQDAQGRTQIQGRIDWLNSLKDRFNVNNEKEK